MEQNLPAAMECAQIYFQMPFGVAHAISAYVQPWQTVFVIPSLTESYHDSALSLSQTAAMVLVLASKVIPSSVALVLQYPAQGQYLHVAPDSALIWVPIHLNVERALI
jgi:hypothetical protein